MAAHERQKQERSDRKKQGVRADKFILRHWWISVISRTRSWNLSIRNTKARVLLRGEIVKDDSGSCAEIAEQGSSASQMTAARSQWTVNPDCQGAQDQQPDAVSAYTQVKMEDAPILLKIPKSECPRYLDTSTKAQMAQIHVPIWKDPSRSSRRGLCTVILRQDHFGKGNLRKLF